MSLFENFPYTNLHNLNLDWLIKIINDLKEGMVVSVNGQTGEVILYQNATVQFPDIPESQWSIVRNANGTSCGFVIGNDGTTYIVHGGLMSEVYCTRNQPPYPVTRVNGMTGDITLYTDRVVRLPSLTDADIHSWNIFRDMNNVSTGIEFDEAGDAYIVFGVNRYKIYTANSQPPYPVASVNGETGDVYLFNDEAGVVEFPAITDPSAQGWVIGREVDGHTIGLVLAKDGSLYFVIDSDSYTVYTSNDPQPDWVDDPTDDIIEVSDQATNNTWGFIRETATAPVGILFSNAVQNSPEAYIRYTDSNNTVQTVRLLTTTDIPSSSVVSVNGLGGIVVLTGEDINVSTLDTRKVNTVLASLETAKQVNRAAMAYNETSNVATNDIPAGAYVFWNNGAYKASQNISYGDTLSSANLTAIEDSQNQSCGFANDINSNLTNKQSKMLTTTLQAVTTDSYGIVDSTLSTYNYCVVSASMDDSSDIAGYMVIPVNRNHKWAFCVGSVNSNGQWICAPTKLVSIKVAYFSY